MPAGLTKAPHPERSEYLLHLAAIGFVLLVCLAVVGVDFSNLWHQRSREMREAWQNTANLARSLGQHAEATLRIVDAGLLGFASRLEMDGTAPEKLDQFRQIMVSRMVMYPAQANFIIADETGRCLMTAAPQVPPGCSLVDRDYFQYHRSHDDRSARLGSPVKGKASGSWVMTLSRRFNHQDGSFAGVIVAGIELSYFQRFYDTLNIGPNGAILLATADGVLITRRPFSEENIGRDLSGSRLFRDFLAKSPVGDEESTSTTDGVKRLTSYRRLDAYPLVIAVAAAETDVLADWRVDGRANMIRTAGLVGLIAVLGGLLALRIRRHEQLESAHRDTASAFRLLAENTSDLIVRLGPGMERLYVSPASRSMLGYEPEELLDRRTDDIVYPEDRSLWLAAFGMERHWTEDVTATYRVRRKDGSPIWVEVQRRRLPGGDGFVAVTRDITERKRAEDKLAVANQRLKLAANQDALTGLANRRHFDTVLEAEFRRAMRDDTSLSLIMLDVDYFKSFNDRYGHPAGDRCLQQLARALAGLPGRPGDLVARYGGEELAIILPNTPVQGASIVAERARAMVRALAIPHPGNPAQIVTISLGIAATGANPRLSDPNDLIQAADRALYNAKAQGRDRACVDGDTVTAKIGADA